MVCTGLENVCLLFSKFCLPFNAAFFCILHVFRFGYNNGFFVHSYIIILQILNIYILHIIIYTEMPALSKEILQPLLLVLGFGY